ncbi:C45 family autoproteolytic acyltransferase/hydolase [Saccharicrinis sp. FJH54]|uniref:C45 family autoproteolytic acyltransferase/hydolase n=1 Tax=Saccharicrinis sp. FJH54 TaxID=3344665 RepID=UPI0035D47075
MNRKLRHIITLIGIVFLVSGCKLYTAYTDVMHSHLEASAAAHQGEPRLEIQNNIPVLHLYGTPAEMGSQYGSILKTQLSSVVFMVEKVFPKRMIRKYLAFADQAEPSLPPGYKAFLKAMAESSDIEYKKLLAMNIVPKTSCSVLAVWDKATPDGNLLMGRNADYNLKKINKALGIIIVKHPDKGYATVASSFIGLVGSLTGINEKGVCFGNMLVDNSKKDSTRTDGLPIHLWMQIGSEKSATAREMVSFLTQQKQMIPINVMCADTSEAIIAELGLNKYAVREGSKGVLASSNYFYTAGMYSEPETDVRFANLMLNARDHYGDFNLTYLQHAMYTARVPNKNLQCVLFEPSKMLMHVSMNKVPASKGPFFSVDVRKLLAE